MCALIGNLQLANPIIRIQEALHNTNYLQDCRTASDPYKSERRPLYQTNIEMPISKWYQNCICNWACRCENGIYRYNRQIMVDVVSAAEFHRPDSRTASNRYQFDIGRFIGPKPEWRYRNYIKMAYLPRFWWRRNKPNSPVSHKISTRCEQLEQRKLAQTLSKPTDGWKALFHEYYCYTKHGDIITNLTLRNRWSHVAVMSTNHNVVILSMDLYFVLCSKTTYDTSGNLLWLPAD